ncbi:hypothetical protein SAMN02745165_00302 [Malonomonas rubra DSM 5091]|uniref:Uncharacterized protein n=1 Tax=Malonomonas rubra DSM 5091 TaxID=1122189 RepID=A0A1M6BU29_MALRU|nr:hypothetical protein [Malonomonas rubra]SHI52292.1 hypothetical protein SAMN02745165_00302 [Malonomonas rubra DSM 5091]
MIWLSPMTGTEEGSVYFDIRDISLQPTGRGTDGVISGLLGDGQREIWGEVHLGSQPQVRILPLWTDDGQIEELSLAVDEELLKQQLLESVQNVFSTVERWAVATSFEDVKPIVQSHDWLAA